VRPRTPAACERRPSGPRTLSSSNDTESARRRLRSPTCSREPKLFGVQTATWQEMLPCLFIAAGKNREPWPSDEAVFELQGPSVDVRQVHSMWQVRDLEKQAFRRLPGVWTPWVNSGRDRRREQIEIPRQDSNPDWRVRVVWFGKSKAGARARTTSLRTELACHRPIAVVQLGPLMGRWLRRQRLKLWEALRSR
jgi:hypothetical protein